MQTKILLSAVCCAAALAQAAPANLETQAYFDAYVAQMQRQLPLKFGMMMELHRVDFAQGELHADYRLLPETAAKHQEDKRRRGLERFLAKDEGGHLRLGWQQGYLIDVCAVPPPVRPVAMRFRLLDRQGKVIRSERFAPELCGSQAAKGAQSGVIHLPPQREVNGVRNDGGEIHLAEGRIEQRFTLVHMDFNRLPAGGETALYASMRNQAAALMCGDGTLLGGMGQVGLRYRDKNGQALPEIVLTRFDCLPDSGATPADEPNQPGRTKRPPHAS